MRGRDGFVSDEAPRELVLFGYVAQTTRAPHERMVDFALTVSQLSGLELALCEAHSYGELAELVQHKKVDVAWLPPLAFIALERHNLVRPLVTVQRDGHDDFYSVIIVAADSKIRDPRGLKARRAAWVDRYSAAGYVLPRIGLFATGIDPRSAFVAEKFFGSHEGVVRAVVEGRADFGGTYAGTDPSGKIVRGSWLEVPGAENAVRVLATFGTIPNDLIGARPTLKGKAREALTRTLVGLSSDPDRHQMIRDLFGADAFRRWAADEAYGGFKKATMEASENELLDGEEHGKM
jgi:phosphate/phosphite/phosphonate ABC transporter binding protein